MTSDLCVLIQRTLILAALTGCCYFSLHLFIIHLFKGGVLLRLRTSLWLLKFDPGSFAFMQMICICTVLTCWASKCCNRSENSHQYTLCFCVPTRDKDTRLLSCVYCFTSHLIFEYSQDQVEGKKSSHVMRFEQQNTIQSNKWETDTNNMISAVFPVVPCRSFIKLPFSLLMSPTCYISLL